MDSINVKTRELTQEHISENTKAGHYTGQVTRDVQDVNSTSIRQKCTVNVVDESSDSSHEGITDTKATKIKGRIGRGKGKGLESTNETDDYYYYSFHFQCCDCLTLHEGKIKSDTQLLEIECKTPLTWNNEVNAPDLFYLLGKPRICGRVNHVYGRRIRGKK